MLHTLYTHTHRQVFPAALITTTVWEQHLIILQKEYYSVSYIVMISDKLALYHILGRRFAAALFNDYHDLYNICYIIHCNTRYHCYYAIRRDFVILLQVVIYENLCLSSTPQPSRC